MNRFKNYSLNHVIVCKEVRYVKAGNRGEFLLFHHITELNIHKSRAQRTINGKTISFIPKFLTKNCDSMDPMGFCIGHKITEKEFIDTYCDGVKPEQIKLEE